MNLRIAQALLAAALLVMAQRGLACNKNIDGSTLHWALALCATQQQTDDYDGPAVQACLDKLIKHDGIKADSENCRLNARYKKAWCAELAKTESVKSAAACFRSAETRPRNVIQGHIGAD